jgi:hypothetical protein
MVAIVDNPPTARSPIHVFVLGVSRYRHLADGSEPTEAGEDSGLEQLTSAARSASEFAAWILKEHHDPNGDLASLFVNLAPSDDEVIHPVIATELQQKYGATRAEVMADWLEFRKRCKARRDATAFVYVAGHGVQLTTEGAVILLEDFAGDDQESTLWAALDMKGLHSSLNGKDAAQHQFWFIDACREEPEAAKHFAQLAGAFGGDQLDGRSKASPMFLAAGPRQRAFAKPFGVSLFCEALLANLRREAADSTTAGEDQWRVTTASLAAHLGPRVLRESGSGRQMVEVTGHHGTGAEVLHVFEQPPWGTLVVRLDPPAAENGSSASVLLDDDVMCSTAKWPLVHDLRVGLYIIHVTPTPPFKESRKPIAVSPRPSEPKIVKVKQA